jgi:hypothetical protein
MLIGHKVSSTIEGMRSYNAKRSRSSYAPRSSELSGSRKAARKLELKMLDSYARDFVPNTLVNGGIASNAAMKVTKFGTPGAADPVVSNATAQGACLNNVSIGSAGYQREGRKINMRDVLLQYVIQYGSGLAQNSFRQSRVFVALVLDMQANGAAPNATDVFVTGYDSTDVADTLATLPQVNMANVNRYKVLKIAYHDPIIEPTLLAGSANCFASSQSGSFSVKLGIPTTFRTDVSTSPATVQIGDIADTALFVLAWTGSSASTVRPIINWAARLTYTG